MPIIRIHRKKWKGLSIAIELYLGKFPHAYGGAQYFRNEADAVLKKLALMDFPEFSCGLGDRITKELDLSSPEEMMGVIRALEIYNGHYPDAYSGAKLWLPNTKILLAEITQQHRDYVCHLL